MIRRPPRSTPLYSSAASDVYKRQVAGLIDVLGDVRIRQIGIVWIHAGGNVLAVLLSLWNFFVRLGHADAAHVFPTGMLLSAIVVGILLVTGWLGWEMVYRHKVGVAD